MDPDGGNPRRITNHPATDREPTCSADGKEIMFTSERDGNGEIYIMNADGSNQTNLTNHRGYDDRPHLYDPRGLSVFPSGKFKATWAWIKQNIE